MILNNLVKFSSFVVRSTESIARASYPVAVTIAKSTGRFGVKEMALATDEVAIQKVKIAENHAKTMAVISRSNADFMSAFETLKA